MTLLAHAAYLGRELAKAETALALGLEYDQDRPLTRPGDDAERSGGRREGGGAVATVLAIAAHPDDELFGAGYLAKLTAEGNDLVDPLHHARRRR